MRWKVNRRLVEWVARANQIGLRHDITKPQLSIIIGFFLSRVESLRTHLEAF